MDFVNVKDIVQANVLGLESDVVNEVFNVATQTQTSVRQLAEILLQSLGKHDLKPEFLPRPVLVQKREGDISKIAKMLGYKVTVDARSGLSEVAATSPPTPRLLRCRIERTRSAGNPLRRPGGRLMKESIRAFKLDSGD